jgi:2-isopropylmalate synthase
VFDSEYINRLEPLHLVSYNVTPGGTAPNNIEVSAKVRFNGVESVITGRGNGPINALVNAIEKAGWKQFRVLDYSQHALTSGSAAKAASYVCVERTADSRAFWGAAVDANIEIAGLKALVSAFNRAHSK